ncbi:hypothetical protein L5515_016802 [Caenorhabditis briggsae]|uniref:Uncharacterized protein n=1 Tax=Caenorhabditis briggsae TaxID=6238 RepID=A0AAE9CTC1_CAEBR|nr:hypothetical protein L3Y34_010919 [Caenorhabditis briggsae]UMM39998.1 hypothetical protein L5515_016802 [Caenorhabditis briggsae]
MRWTSFANSCCIILQDFCPPSSGRKISLKTFCILPSGAWSGFRCIIHFSILDLTFFNHRFYYCGKLIKIGNIGGRHKTRDGVPGRGGGVGRRKAVYGTLTSTWHVPAAAALHK